MYLYFLITGSSFSWHHLYALPFQLTVAGKPCPVSPHTASSGEGPGLVNYPKASTLAPPGGGSSALWWPIWRMHVAKQELISRRMCFREYCVHFKQAPALETQCLHLYSWKNSQLKELCFPYTKLLNSLNISIKSPEVRNGFKREIFTETFTEDAFNNTLCILFQKPSPRDAPPKKRHAFAPQQLPIGILRLDFIPAQLSSSHPHQNQNLESSFPKTWTTTESWTLLHSLGPEIRDEMLTVALPALT